MACFDARKQLFISSRRVRTLGAAAVAFCFSSIISFVFQLSAKKRGGTVTTSYLLSILNNQSKKEQNDKEQ
jgi:hypothetical protein